MSKIKALGLGLCLLPLIFLVTLIKGDIGLMTAYSGVVGLFFLLLAALFSGAFVSPDSRRVDEFNEGKEQLERKIRWSTYCLLISLPSLITCISLFYSNN